MPWLAFPCHFLLFLTTVLLRRRIGSPRDRWPVKIGDVLLFHGKEGRAEESSRSKIEVNASSATNEGKGKQRWSWSFLESLALLVFSLLLLTCWCCCARKLV